MSGTVFFYSHAQSNYPEGCKYHVFSQWYQGSSFKNIGALIYETPIEMPAGEEYTSTEKWMMLGKARRFDDQQAIADMSASNDPKQLKARGRKVAGFDKDSWDAIAFQHVVNGNYLKFSQNPELKAILLATGDKYLAEATHDDDRIWGIGYPAKTAEQRDEAVKNEGKWGSNLLGKALMKVREHLSHSF
jgi:ribA/ribD-fused uncharacterized protein